MTFKLFTLAISALALVACGGSDAGDNTAGDNGAPSTETTNTSEPSPSALPPAIVYAQDGDTITGKVGEEISVKLERIGDAAGHLMWRPVDPDYQGVVEPDKTWRTIEGDDAYDDVLLKGLAPGSVSITYEQFHRATPSEGLMQRTITVVVN